MADPWISRAKWARARGSSSAFPAPGSDLAPATLSPLAAPSGSACVRPLRIQLIDDDELIRETFPEFMEILGHRVLATAEDGSSGLRQIEEGLEVDVVVLDHNMPGLSGVETLTRLRSLRPGLPIVFCSGTPGGRSEKPCDGMFPGVDPDETLRHQGHPGPPGRGGRDALGAIPGLRAVVLTQS